MQSQKVKNDENSTCTYNLKLTWDNSQGKTSQSLDPVIMWQPLILVDSIKFNPHMARFFHSRVFIFV